MKKFIIIAALLFATEAAAQDTTTYSNWDYNTNSITTGTITNQGSGYYSGQTFTYPNLRRLSTTHRRHLSTRRGARTPTFGAARRAFPITPSYTGGD